MSLFDTNSFPRACSYMKVKYWWEQYQGDSLSQLMHSPPVFRHLQTAAAAAASADSTPTDAHRNTCGIPSPEASRHSVCSALCQSERGKGGGGESATTNTHTTTTSVRQRQPAAIPSVSSPRDYRSLSLPHSHSFPPVAPFCVHALASQQSIRMLSQS